MIEFIMRSGYTLNNLKQVVKDYGLKYSRQREIIFKTLLNSPKHLSAEELYNAVNCEYPKENIGIATIYRALAFFEESKLISSIDLNKDGKKFELNDNSHHDHLICIKCNAIIEFLDEEIEKRQEFIANKFEFKLINHTMFLYGICSKCQNDNKDL